MGWYLNPIRKWLDIFMMFVPLLYQWTYLDKPIVIIADNIYTWISLMITLVFQWYAQNLQT